MNNLMCPISNDKADENIARVSALFTMLLTGLSLYLNAYGVMFILGLDFVIRGFTTSDCSFIKFISKQIVKSLKLKSKPIDLAPKKFAAKVGMIFAFTIAVLQFFNLIFIANIFGGVLILFSFLECFLGFCMGCFVYTMYIKLIFKK